MYIDPTTDGHLEVIDAKWKADARGLNPVALDGNIVALAGNVPSLLSIKQKI